MAQLTTLSSETWSLVGCFYLLKKNTFCRSAHILGEGGPPWHNTFLELSYESRPREGFVIGNSRDRRSCCARSLECGDYFGNASAVHPMGLCAKHFASDLRFPDLFMLSRQIPPSCRILESGDRHCRVSVALADLLMPRIIFTKIIPVDG